MSNYIQKSTEEDSRSFEGNGDREVEEEGFFNFKEEGSCSSLHQTWSPFEDLDDSGHFTASPDGERALSGSSRSHSPCSSSSHLLLEMQNQERNSRNLQQSQSPQFTQMQFSPKPLISPRSVMTVKVPHTTNSLDYFQLNNANVLASSVENGACSNETCSKKVSDSLDNDEDTIPRLGEIHSTTTVGKNGDVHISPNTSPDESSDYLKNILDNFNSLYMEKLRMIDDIPTNSEEQKMFLLEKKTSMLENWAKDVCVQNMVLVHTVEELEKEANRKVAALQTKITESTQLAKEHMNMIKKYEQQVKLLLKNHSDAEEKSLVLKIDLEKLKSECRRVKDRMNSLLKDNESLITLVCRIRDMGVWDVNGLELQRSSFDQIFGLYPNLVGGEVQTVFTREKAKHVKDTEDKVLTLETQLKELTKSHNEVEAESLIKDRKIEDLDTEIKNLSNKLKYCEQECNDYKKSLLETQEKLLDATRKLNSAKYSSRQQPTTDPNKNEMAELIKELREVKSQLNTAVEEKQSAKEESNYFKRELGDRLKEMHDIQNVFQSLATEVVNSRAAFQQVQEKEVQLKSLKSEVQTYQSRCADAEDTIRKKEKEIKQLQKQMNEIHRRSKKPTSISSSNQYNPTVVPSERPDSTIERFTNYFQDFPRPTKIPDRNAKPKIPVRLQNKGASAKNKNTYKMAPYQPNPKTKVPSNETIKPLDDNEDDNRPPWNTNFKGLRLVSKPPPAFKPNSRSSASKVSLDEMSTKRMSTLETEDGIRHITKDCEHIFEKLADIEGRLASTEIPLKRAQIKPTNKVEIDFKQNEAFRSEILKLPKVLSKTSGEKKHTKDKSDSGGEGGLKGEKLPKVKGKSSNVRNKDSHKKTNNPVLKNLMQNPFAPTPRLNELITAVVETSKQLLGSEGDSPVMKSKDISSFTITAARYRKNKHDKTTRRAQSSDRVPQMNRENSSGCGGGDGEVEIDKSPLNLHSSTEKHHTKKEEENPKPNEVSEDATVSDEEASNARDILINLPQDSHEDIVKSWIKKSSNHSFGEKSKRPPSEKLPPKPSRRPSVKVMRHLATRRYPRRLNSARSKKSSERTDEKGEMFELEDEWSQVFANLECKANGAKVKVGGEKAEAGKSLGLSENSTKPLASSARTSTSMDSSVESNTTMCQDEPMQELLNRLAAENREMQQRFQKELQEKDIELRMQKVTIQHLQDAYVALKRGQPIPVPQNVTGNKIMVNGSSNGHHNHNQPIPCDNTSCSSPMDGNFVQSLFTPCYNTTLFVPVDESGPIGGVNVNSTSKPCSCSNCSNKACISKLIAQFEDHKSNMLTEIGELKSFSCQLNVKSAILDDRIKSLTELVHNSSSTLSELYSKNKLLQLSKRSGQEQDKDNLDYQQLPKGNLKNALLASPVRSEKLKGDIRLLKTLAAVIDKGLANRFDGLKKSLEDEKQQMEIMFQDKNEIESRLREAIECNQFLSEKVQHLETLVNDLLVNSKGSYENSNANASDSDDPLDYSLGRLEAMKNAFDSNQNLIFAQERELGEKELLISKYKRFVHELTVLVGSIITNQDVLSGSDLSVKLNHLCDCVRQVLADNGLMCKKLDALQQMMQASNKENILLNETVASLNEHINALSRQNDKLLLQFNKCGQRRCKSPLVLSTISSPRSDICEGAENEVRSEFVVDTRASGDPSCQTKTFPPKVGASDSPANSRFSKKIDDICPCLCYTCSKSESSLPSADISFSHALTIPSSDVHQGDTTAEYLSNLKLMMNCLQDLSRSTTRNSPNFNNVNFSNNDAVNHNTSLEMCH